MREFLGTLLVLSPASLLGLAWWVTLVPQSGGSLEARAHQGSVAFPRQLDAAPRPTHFYLPTRGGPMTQPYDEDTSYRELATVDDLKIFDGMYDAWEKVAEGTEELRKLAENMRGASVQSDMFDGHLANPYDRFHNVLRSVITEGEKRLAAVLVPPEPAAVGEPEE